jgi:secreted trypsin-like serine protease
MHKAYKLLMMIPFFIAGTAVAEQSNKDVQQSQLRAVSEKVRKEITSPNLSAKDRLMLELTYQKDEFKDIAGEARRASKEQESNAALAHVDRLERQLDLLADIPNRRIVGPGAQKAPADQFRYQVAIVFSNAFTPYMGQICGGTVINPSWVLTAAHCFNADSQPGDFQVYTGSAKLSSGGQLVDLVNIYRHKDFNPKTMGNDIALLHLAKPLDVSFAITPLPQEKQNLINTGKLVVASGWGATVEGGLQKPDSLLFNMLKVVSPQQCNAPESYGGVITEQMLCAGDGVNDSCQGDSGGPLVVKDKATRYLAGVVSWGEGCGRPKKYGVYTKVSAYSQWINQTMAQVASNTQ